ncbi:MAG: 16S rRNA (cytidine(1402)-2'-O)-methyltransferase [Gammaproteobacteria bacterium]
MAKAQGTLWVVATPIGNLEDLSPRARRVLAEVDRVLCEDTRRTGRLLAAFGIRAELVSVHEHNESDRVPGLLTLLAEGSSMALVSDAGTPLVSDPGFRLVQAAAGAGLDVRPVPGPCAAVAALSVAGLPTDRFAFHGFLPPRAAARRAALESVSAGPSTLVFYETGQRLQAFFEDAAAVLGRDRPAVLARELTKLHESVYRGSLASLAEMAGRDPDVRRGEAVVVVGGAPAQPAEENEALLRRLLPALLEELPPSRAVRLAAKLTGQPRNRVYRLAMSLDGNDPEGPPEA